MTSCEPPTRDPEQTEPGSWPSSRSQSRAFGSGRARRTSTSAAGTHRPRHGNCGRPEERTEGREKFHRFILNIKNLCAIISAIMCVRRYTYSDLGPSGLVDPVHVFAELRAVSVSVPVVLGDKQQRVDHLMKESLRRQTNRKK